MIGQYSIQSKSAIVNRAISGPTTINSNCYAVVTYEYDPPPEGGYGYPITSSQITRYFGPGQSVIAKITIAEMHDGSIAEYSLKTGIEFVNNP